MIYYTKNFGVDDGDDDGDDHAYIAYVHWDVLRMLCMYRVLKIKINDLVYLYLKVRRVWQQCHIDMSSLETTKLT